MNKAGYYGRRMPSMMLIVFILSIPIFIMMLNSTGALEPIKDQFICNEYNSPAEHPNTEVAYLSNQVAALKDTNQEQRLTISNLKKEVNTSQCPTCDFQFGYVFFLFALILFSANYYFDKKRKAKLEKRESDLRDREERLSAKGKNNYNDDSDKSKDIHGVKLQG